MYNNYTSFSSVVFGHMSLFGLSFLLLFSRISSLFLPCNSSKGFLRNHPLPRKLFHVTLFLDSQWPWISICVKRELNVSPSVVALGAPVSSSPALCSTDRGPMRACVVPLTLSKLAHHLMVLVGQNSGQEEGSFVRAPCFKAPPGPSLSIDGHIPLPFRTGTAFAAPYAGPCWRRLGGCMVP